MADVRLIAAAVVAAAACGRAGAAPEGARSGIAPPAGWSAQPLLVQAAEAALGKTATAGGTIDGVEAWAEPAMGCYAVWVAMRAPGDGQALAEQVIAGFGVVGAAGSGEAKLVPSAIVRPAGDTGVLALAFERGEHRGRLRVQLGGERLAALACFANAREPAACETACTTLLAAIPAKVTP